LEEIKKDQTTLNIPVIIQSGAADEEEKQKCFMLGAHSFLAKPYTRHTVIELINSTFSVDQFQSRDIN